MFRTVTAHDSKLLGKGTRNLITPNTVVEIIGEDIFRWMLHRFDQTTTLKDIPGEILQRLASVKVPQGMYGSDQNSLTCIAVLTFAYKLKGKQQSPKFAEKDMLLVKVLARNELARRKGKKKFKNPYWDHPVYELIAGQIGDRIRLDPFAFRPG